MIDNFEKVLDLMKFGDHTYYYLQIIQRRKDSGNSEMKTAEQQKWSKFITSKDELRRVQEDTKKICDLFGARAYIELNPRCLEKFSILLAKKLLNRIYLKDYAHISSLRNKVALLDDTIKTRGITDSRRWTLDIDNLNDLEIIKNWTKEKGIDIISEIPTPNGIHLLIKAFNYRPLNIKIDSEFEIKDGVKTTIKPFANSVLYYGL